MAWLRLLPVILFAFSSISMLTYEQGILARVAEVVQRWNSQVTYEYISDGWVEFTDLHGKTFQRKVAHESNQIANQPHKLIVINVPEIDTTGFAGMFSMIARLPIGTGVRPSLGFNGRSGTNYILGRRFVDGAFPPSQLFEYSDQVASFRQVYQYEEGLNIVPVALGKIYGSSPPHLMTDSGSTITVYDTPHGFDYPVRRSIGRPGNYSSKQEPRLFDFDSDGLDELVVAGSSPGNHAGTIVSEYDVQQNGLKDVFESNFNKNFHWGSWAVGDFDMDGKGEFATVTNNRFVIFVEYTGDKSEPYREIFTDVTRGANGGFNHEGNDLDQDGRPEAFLGSDFFGGIMNIAVYEPIGDNAFEDSVWIEIAGVGALSNSLVTGDVDGDGIDELIITYGGMLLILKATANDEYEPYWLKFFSSEIGVRLFDFNNDGNKELIVGQNEGWSGFTEIYSHRTVSSYSFVPDISEQIVLHQNYPNPVTTGTNITFSVSTAGIYNLSIYNSTGNLISLLFNEHVAQGKFTFPLTTGDLPPGMYFYTLTYKKFSKTGKFLILR